MADAPSPPLGSSSATPGSVPKAPFAEDVQKLITPGLDAAQTLDQFRTLLTKYQIIEDRVSTKRAHLEAKIKEIKDSIKVIECLIQSSSAVDVPIKVDFEIGDTMYTSAQLSEPNVVHLWLGANIMMAYPREQALDLLKTKLNDNLTNLTSLDEQGAFIKEQITTMEVNMARLYNWENSLISAK